jgi:hypothetical protein
VEASATHLSRSSKLHPVLQAKGNRVIAAVKSVVDVHLLPKLDKRPGVDAWEEQRENEEETLATSKLLSLFKKASVLPTLHQKKTLSLLDT